MPIRTADVIMPGNDNQFGVGERGQLPSLAALDPAHRWMLEKNVTGALATVNANGLPQLTPVWVGHDGTHVLINTKKGRLKERNMRARPDVSLLLVNPQNPYHWISLRGRVVDIVDETDPARGREATETIDDAAQRYLGTRPYPLRDPKGEVRVLFKVQPTYIMTFGPPPAS